VIGNEVPDLIRRILSENPHKSVSDPALTPAAVTLLLYPKDGQHCVLMQKRSQQVEHHKGEISFPGGMRDESDVDLRFTALREAHEEMGILPEDVDLLGQIDDVSTISNFVVSTFVGTIPYPYEFTTSEVEVAAVLEVPLSSLLDKANRRDDVRLVNGKLNYASAFAHDGHIIFGATAKILDQFLALLENAPCKEAPWLKNRLPQ
jgi:8-oxo-dGTP pyrophosphatase MutT (NUDIX family)